MHKSTPYLLLVLALALGGCRSTSEPDLAEAPAAEKTPAQIRAAALVEWRRLQAEFGEGWFERTECLQLGENRFLFAKGVHQFRGKKLDPVVDPQLIEVTGPFFYASPGLLLIGATEKSSFKMKRNEELTFTSQGARASIGNPFPKPYPWMRYVEEGINKS